MTAAAHHRSRSASSTDVTVVIPAYRAAAVLDTALASVAAQTEPAGAVVVVDDASGDDTAEVATRWKGRLGLHVERLEDNIGAGAARRHAMSLVQTPLVALLDADDAWLPDHLEVMTAQYRRAPGLVSASNLRWAPGRRLAQLSSAQRLPVPPPDAQLDWLLRGNFVYSGCLFSVEDHTRAGGFPQRRRSEDWELWLRMVLAGVQISSPGHPTVLYRKEAGTLSADAACVRDDIEMLTAIRADLPDEVQGIVDRSLRRRRASLRFSAGLEARRRGRRAAGTAELLAAAALDRSLRGGTRQVDGSVTLRALAAIVLGERINGVRMRFRDDPDRSWPRSAGAADAP